jgi:hypothetical protein
MQPVQAFRSGRSWASVPKVHHFPGAQGLPAAFRSLTPPSVKNIDLDPAMPPLPRDHRLLKELA